MSQVAIVDRAVSVRQGRRLEYFTIGWNIVEGLVAVGAGLLAASISLVGFGIDSFIEVTPGSVLLWRMSVDAKLRFRRMQSRTQQELTAEDRSATPRSRFVANRQSAATRLAQVGSASQLVHEHSARRAPEHAHIQKPFDVPTPNAPVVEIENSALI